MTSWKDVAVGPELPLRDTIALIDKSSLQVAVVLNTDGRLAGLLTDGDIRRAILRGVDLHTPTKVVMNTRATAAPASTSREELMALMRRKAFRHLPLVDEERCVVGLVTLDDLMGSVERSNWVVLMAGGMGTRLRPLTEECPKPLLAIGGKPILQTILESFIEQGFKRYFVSVHYRAEMIRDYFGDGSRWGVELEYLYETSMLGTAGALSLLPTQPKHPFVVMNGDLLTRTNFGSLLEFHEEHGAAATMVVRDYGYQVPYGVVRLEGTKIGSIEEKPTHRFFVSAGIYVLSPSALSHVPNGTFFDMPSLFESLIAAKETTAAYPLREYWLDIGRIEELERAQREWQGPSK
ncbi:MAG: nucleotidyltransferase family protein [Alphaproteobacteria bacterium]|nr:nucleotidyltransferase family protein [Alphaproteobacteria bacterium]